MIDTRLVRRGVSKQQKENQFQLLDINSKPWSRYLTQKVNFDFFESVGEDLPCLGEVLSSPMLS